MSDILRANDLPGYETVRDLIPQGNFLGFTHIWNLRMEYVVTALNELELRLTLDLGETMDLDDRPLICLVMIHPVNWTLPGDRQITGLGFQDIRDDQWERLNYRVHDYEQNQLDLYCQSIELSRADKPCV